MRPQSVAAYVDRLSFLLTEQLNACTFEYMRRVARVERVAALPLVARRQYKMRDSAMAQPNSVKVKTP